MRVGNPERIAERIHGGPASDRCGPDEAAAEYVSQQSLFIDQQTKASFESAYQYSTFEEARRAMPQIEARTGFFFNDTQRSELEEIVAFALNYQVGTDDVISIAEDVAINVQNEDDFLYSLMTVVSLRVSSYLSDLNVASGGGAISEDFDQIAQTVEQAIRDGRVLVKAGSIFEQDEDHIQLQGFGSPGIYDHSENELVFQVIDGGFSLFRMLDHNKMMFNTVVHECVHIYQDYLAEKISFMESELTAYEISQKAQQLLEESVVFYHSPMELELLSEERRELAEFRTGLVIGDLQCRGYDENMIGFEEEYWIEKERISEEWIREIGWELGGSDLGLSSSIYLNLLSIKHLYNVMNRNLMREGAELAGKIEKFESEPLNVARALTLIYDMDKRRLITSRQALFDMTSDEKTTAASARTYLHYLSAVIVYSYYLEPGEFNEYTDEYVDMSDFIATSLLYEERTYDGL